MKRRFTQGQKRMFAWLSGGCCRSCGARLSQDFHSDHVVPFSKGGPTTVINGQALCPRCNLSKGKKWN